MKIYIESNRNFTEEVRYTWTLFASTMGIKSEFTESPAAADISIDSTAQSDLPVAIPFYDALAESRFEHANFLKTDCWIRDALGRKDYLATAFYMVNSLQEYGASDLDEIGRFQYMHSYQHKFNCMTENLVQQCFNHLSTQLPALASHPSPRPRTKIFLSHDIDSVNGALLQDGYYLLRKRKPHLIWSVIFNAVLQRPDWLNMDKIMNLEDEFSFKSTFFWIVNKGRINPREVNADYNIQGNKIRKIIGRIQDRGWEVGLHKSISGETLKQELSKSGFTTEANRYHYLKFTLPGLYDAIEASALKLDASLGFAEAYGFRNSYGLPFVPFNLKQRKKYSFLEVPLNIMDGTFQQYLHVPKENTAVRIIDFIEKNQFNCLLSILWHNTFFTDHKFNGYRDIYKKVLAYLFESKMECVNVSGILKQYSWQE